MKRGLFIILFVIALLFISGLQSCQPVLTIGSPNSCCKLTSNVDANCINDISQLECDNLYTIYGSYYKQETYQNGLANSCNDTSGCDTFTLSCKYQDSIFENGEYFCLESKIYNCINGSWQSYKDCDVCVNNKVCSNPNIVQPKVMCSDGDCALIEEAYFRFSTPPYNETFIFKLTDPEKIQKARDILANRQPQHIIMGKIEKESVDYNPPWSYHLNSSTISFEDFAIELCDASIPFIENNLDRICGNSSMLPDCVWCPWSSHLLEEIPISKI